MENLSLNIIPLALFVMLFMVEFLLLHVINLMGGTQKFLLRYRFFIKSKLGFSDEFDEFSNQDSCSSEKTEDGILNREDLEIMMGKLGLFCTPEDEKRKENLGFDDISNLFEEREPSLEEVKGAFDVFDQNRDGFIDAEELQRVLCVLGFKEGFEMENCRRMIRVFNKNGDERISLSEFVKVMEITS